MDRTLAAITAVTLAATVAGCTTSPDHAGPTDLDTYQVVQLDNVGEAIAADCATYPDFDQCAWDTAHLVWADLYANNVWLVNDNDQAVTAKPEYAIYFAAINHTEDMS